MKTIICDLDGTLFNIDHRLHFLDKKDWDGFFDAVPDDTPNQWCVDLLHAMILAGHEVVFVSGRNERVREITERWLDVLGFGGAKLYMRPEKNREPDYLLKHAYYKKHLKFLDILFVIEDRKQVCDMWRAKGLTVLQCDEGDF